MNVQQRLRKVVLVAGLAVAAASVSGANFTPKTHDPQRSINGTLTEYRGGIMKVETDKGEAWEFNVLPETGIAVNGTESERSSLKPGMHVAVTPSREEPSRASSVVASTPQEEKQ